MAVSKSLVMSKMSELTTALVHFNQVSVFMTLSEVHIHLVEWQNILKTKQNNNL